MVSTASRKLRQRRHGLASAGSRFDRLFNFIRICWGTLRTVGLKPAGSLVLGEVEFVFYLLLTLDE